MFVYEKKLQYPIKITTPNPKLAAIIISQYGGPDTNRLQNRLRIYHPEPVSFYNKDTSKNANAIFLGSFALYMFIIVIINPASPSKSPTFT